MPAPASEDDLKRRARRRLIGAVALTLAAVIALPLLLEDEPPPATRLEVKMPPVAALPEPVQPEPVTNEASPDEKPVPVADTRPVPQDKPEPIPHPKPVPNPVVTPKPESKPAHQHETAGFVVQLGAFSEIEKVSALKTRASKLGLPCYTDKSGSLTRLRVGPFATREAATQAATQLAKNGLAGQVMPK